MHGPCGEARKKSPCMSDGRCTKNFPKKFVEVTSIDEDGYLVYRRRDNERTFLKNGVNLDNSFVVPHNRYLLIKDAHINVEWCNQSLFKYICSIRGATCYDDISIVNDVQYRSFRDACYALGLLNDDKEYIDGIVEAKLELNEDEIKSHALVEIEKLLRSYGKSLRGFQSMPFPSDEYFQSSQNSLIHDEMRFDRRVLFREHHNLLNNLNDQQRQVYNTIMAVVDSNTGGIFFVYGYGGIGKTFIWKTMSACLRSNGEIVLNVASSGIASLLIPGGRTAHSRFSIPFNPTEESTCNIKQGSPLAELIVKSKVMIWDEAPMTHKFCFEALDKSMKDIMRFVNPSSLHMPFGGKTVVFGGDFRQILPVIPKDIRHDIVLATINSSYLWRHCKILRLTKNMRLQNLGCDQEYAEMKKFSDWIATLGDGKIGEANEGYATIDIPYELLLKDYNDPIATIVESTYLLFPNNVSDATYFEKRAILALILDVVQSVMNT
ncbi:uncharacterized protein [Primulina eburnea]|uniref:uncharacterized protein n=1 Tax=Primulina eburnea TaxID=1245227 RepID=UPI003C6BDF3A